MPEMDSLMVAKFLADCSDEQFAEVFVKLFQLQTYNTAVEESLSKEDMISTSPEDISHFICAALSDILPKDSDMCENAWWKNN